MHAFSENQLLGAFLAIAVVLLVTRGMAELCRRLNQPEVLGELLGGFLIGPSVLGALFPEAFHTLFLNTAVSLALQLMSWIGAILLLMIAGMEADLTILRQKIVPGLLAAAGAIGASVGMGTWLGVRVFKVEATNAFFLGLVLSVTAVSVVAKLLIEREALRRDYAQVMLAAGIAGEVVVWPLISVVSSLQHKTNAFAAGVKASALALGFFAVMFTVGRRFTYWAMRRVADVVCIPNSELSLVLVLLCVSAAATMALGLHPLLGAFVFGVLLGKAPRATVALKERIQALTISCFAPIFFGLAGMRVNLFNLRGAQSIKAILVLFAVAGLMKVLFGFAGAVAGGLPVWEAAAVGVGLNLKGGTDVVVAIVGTELLLLSSDLYTTYAVVAILTVVATPPVINWLAARTRPGEAELKRLNREEARKLAYFAERERVLLPMAGEFLPALSARIVSAIATTKHAENELFDVTELTFGQDLSLTRSSTPSDVIEAASLLSHTSDFEHVGLERITAGEEDFFHSLRRASEGQHLLAMGTTEVRGEVGVSFGEAQDRVLRETNTDVLLTIAETSTLPEVRRMLVPINGLHHAFAAADVAAYVAKGCEAELVLLSVVAPRLGPLFWGERKHRDLLQAGYTLTREAAARVSRLGVKVSEKVVLSDHPAEAILAEMKDGGHDLLVLGCVVRSSDQGLSLGGTTEHLLNAVQVPRVLLLTRTVDAVAAA